MRIHMRKVAILTLVVACGGAKQPVAENVQLATPDAAAVALPNQPIEKLGIPHDAPLVAAFDPAIAARITPLREELERDFDLASGALLANAASLGLDTNRPVTLAVAPLDDAQAKLVAELRAAVPDKNAPVPEALVKRVLSVDSPIIVRVLVPATDAQKLEQTIGKFLQADRWRHVASGWEKHSEHVELSDDGANVAVDFFSSHKGDPKAYRAFTASAHDAAPALDGKTARASWSPMGVAAVGYLNDVIRACGAVSGGSVDPSQRERILQEGFWEASRAFDVASFERVEIEGKLDPFEIVGRAKPSASFVAPPADAFAQSPGISLANVAMLAQASRAFVRGWPFPGGSVKSALESMRDSGGGGLFAGAPHVLAASPMIESRRSQVAAPFDVTRFERVATGYALDSSTVFVSVLPAGTKQKTAECALAPATPCDAKTRLKLNAVVKIGSLNAKLYEIDKRFVVVSSDSDSAHLDAPSFTTKGISGLHLDLDTTVLARVMTTSSIPRTLSGDVSSEDGMLVFTLAPR
jgi:hypothetical protein